MNKDKHKFFDGWAEKWDLSFYQDNEKRKKIDRLILSFNLEESTERILDLGCGTGIISERIINNYGESFEIYACDFSLKMLKQAKRKVCDKAIVICADAHYLPFKNEVFDTAILFSCFPHFDDKEKVLKEVRRVLKKDGQIIISHLLSRRQILNIHKKVGGAVSKDSLPPRKRMFEILNKVGFKIVDYKDRKGIYLLRAEKSVNF